MDKELEHGKREAFRKLLYDLAVDVRREMTATPEKCLECQQRFEEIYRDSTSNEIFRHYYSDIFVVMSQVIDDPEIQDYDALRDHLQNILESYQCREGHPDVRNNLRKLYDHTSLELGRLVHTKLITEQVFKQEAHLDELKHLVNSVRSEHGRIATKVNEHEAFANQIDEAKKEINDAKKEYIAILGIFSAVVLTFIGGIAFSTSVLENLHQSSIYRIVFAICLIGLVLCNVLYLLFFCIYSLMEKTLQKWQKQPLIWCNMIIVTALLFTVLFWYIGLAEKRNARIQNEDRSPNQVVETIVPASQTPLKNE
ncbi:hypothetical protein [uncultured Flavonifractor sp.]|uniref:hypothetical protein n=1 Tax=uncultured Flavonifractor sp. TaxID=1193534 RepID=UPI002612495E|nr:hypothetical protein [uncultured Flavonifractor sp.]